MYQTLEMMKSILNGKEKDVDEKELIKEYQEKLSPNILAYFYVNNFGFIFKTCKLFPKLSYEDKASFCLQELDNCLQTYDISYNTKFITYFGTYYKNRLLSETGLMNTQKRKIIYYTEELDNKKEIIGQYDVNIEDIDIILNNYNLYSEQIEQCKLINAGYSIKEISNIFKIKPITVYYRSEKIKQKIFKDNINFA